jgi:hypothetical protein
MPYQIPYTVEVLDKLRWNAHLGKHKHFEAGNRGRKHHVWWGVPVVLINIFVGSVMFSMLGSQQQIAATVAWVGAILSLLAATLGGIQTFFNFEKQSFEHRAVANEYLAIARECERLLALHFDGFLNLEELSKSIDLLNKSYEKVNSRAEGLTVSAKDFARAKAVQEAKKAEESLVQRFAKSAA